MADAIQIGAPDGSVIKFPAGTDDSTIKAVMAKHYPNAAAEVSPIGDKVPGGGSGMAIDGLGQPTSVDLSAPDRDQNVPAWEKTKRAAGVIDDSVRAIANGIPFADRFAAGMGAATGVGGTFGDYSGNLEKQRAENKRIEDAAPIANTTAHLVGGALTPVGALGAAAKGTGLLAKTLMGMGAGGALGTVQGVSDSPDLTDVNDTAKHGARGAITGTLIGGLIPGTGKAIGAGYNWLADKALNASGLSRPATKHLADALMADTPAAVRSRLDELGPDAMLADAGPAMLGKAQGVTLNSDEGRSLMVNALTGRNEGINQRIMGDVNRVLGPAEDPQTVTNAIRARRSEVDNKAYPAALDRAPEVDLAPYLSQIESAIERTPTGTMERKALENLRNMITVKVEGEAAPVAGGKVASAAETQQAKDIADLRAKFGDAVADAFARQGKAAAEPPQSLLQFIASKGGLGPHPELDAIGLALGHRAQIPSRPGFFGVVNKNGADIDRIREAAEEAGYLRGENGATSTPRDLLDAIDAELRGQKRYPEGFEGSRTKRETTARTERDQHDQDRFNQALDDDLAAAGHGDLAPDVKRRAADLMAKENVDPDTAVERALRQLDEEDAVVASAGFPGDRRPTSNDVRTEQAKRQPVKDARILHKVKQELDNVIEYSAPGLGVPAGALQNQQGALKTHRGQLNSELEKQVPGYSEANRRSAALAKRAEAVQSGTQYLGAGKTTPSPERFAEEFGQLEPGEQIAFAKGSRGNIDRLLGTKANDLQALRGELQGEGGWNTAKIATVHGPEAAEDLVGTVNRNLKFRDTYNKVVENSQTAQRQAAANAMKPEPAGEMPLITPSTTGIGLASAGAKKLANWAWNGMRADPTAQYGEVARVLSAQGTDRDRYYQALADVLLKRGTNRAAAPVIGDRAALAAALLENEYARDRIGRRQ